jgi:lipopolysaccharide/colanic/teichoic acid biosynthesis glycosyltransferase
MIIYRRYVLNPGRALFFNLMQARLILCIVTYLLNIWIDRFSLGPFVIGAHLMLTGTLVLSVCVVIERMAGDSSSTRHVGIISGEAMLQILQMEYARGASHWPHLDWLGKSISEAQASLESRVNTSAQVRHLAIEPEILNDPSAVGFLQRWRMKGMYFENLQEFTERTCGKILIGQETVSDVASSRNFGPSKIDKAIRRARDLVLGCLGLVLTLPLNLLIALAIKLESSGPVLFRQIRVGENGRSFVMLKFRSMYQDGKLIGGREWTTHQNDPRITRVGRVIRLMHLDEIPQLINVLRGEMSLVGPRPFHSAQVAELESLMPSFGLRHLVRPGITGWAQINCDYDASLNQRDEVFARDLYYIKHGGFRFDLLIMLATLRICLLRRGAR